MLNQKILICTNLIGDSLYLLGPLKKYLERSRDEVAALVVDDSIAGQIFIKAFGKDVPILIGDSEVPALMDKGAQMLRLEAGLAATICYDHARRTGRQLHISEGYARMLGVDIEGRFEPPNDWQSHYGKLFAKEHTLISPFSRSCSRHTGEIPNKTLDDFKWEPIIRMLRRHGYSPLKVIGGHADRFKNCTVPESDYISARTLEELESTLRKASLLITLDNGMCHMASALGVKTLVLWPEVSNIDFIAPIWSPKTAIIQMGNPNKVPAAFLETGIRRMLGFIENGKQE